VGLACPALADAQNDTLARSVRITAENDYFDFWRPPGRRPDDNYTQGARVAGDAVHVLPVVRRLVCYLRDACGSTFEVGQELYTPTHDSADPLPGERPYAGWLYARATAHGVTPRQRRSFDLTLGVTGPASLAAQTQDAFHAWIPGFRRPLGWSHQLPTELAGALSVEEAGYVAAGSRAQQWVDLAAAAHATLGTLRTAFGLNARLRVGVNLTHPWLVAPAHDWWEAYALLGGETEAVARDLFLDGSTFRRSIHVRREPIIGSWERGVGVRLWRLGCEYRAVTQSREYRTGPVTHPFGSVSVAWWLLR
jgi:lipid A 3-O-deacylase